MLCCEEGNSEMAELLLNSQADPDLQQSVSGVDNFGILHGMNVILLLLKSLRHSTSSHYNYYSMHLQIHKLGFSINLYRHAFNQNVYLRQLIVSNDGQLS